MAIARDVGDGAPEVMATATYVAVEQAGVASGAMATVTAGARVMAQRAVARARATATATFAPIARVGKGGAPGAMADEVDVWDAAVAMGTAEPGDDAPSLISSVADGVGSLWWVAVALLAAYVAWRALRGRVRGWLGAGR